MTVGSRTDLEAGARLVDEFRAALLLAESSLPSHRCVSRPSLVKIVNDLRAKTDSAPIRNRSATALIRLLTAAGVVRPLPLEAVSPKVRSDRLYLIGLDVDAGDIEPAEILQAHEPNGIICYFTAIKLHGLTTQPAPHHHIARLRKAAAGGDQGSRLDVDVGSDTHQLPLGTELFCVDGLSYYSTQRDPGTLLQVRRRQLNPHCVVRVTSLEQTLLDCLHRPQSAGGAAVVFEAWQVGLPKTSVELVVDLARKVGEGVLLRRVGYMIAQQQPQSAVLAELSGEGLDKGSASGSIPSLLPGINLTRVDPRWQLRVP